VEILCKDCRRAGKSGLVQPSLFGFFGKPKNKTSETGTPSSSREERPPREVNKLDDVSADTPATSTSDLDEDSSEVSDQGALRCARCRRSMQEKAPTDGPSAKKMRSCPFITRLRQYQKVASETGVAWELKESEAVDMMRQPCNMCGTVPDFINGQLNGITRLRTTGERSMGPYSRANTAPSCTPCNMMKGCMDVGTAARVCRHIATHRGLGTYGSFPECFVNNTSKRSRSSYLTESKTHQLTNSEFDLIVSRPCHYCGKPSLPPHHHNGLDRLDSTNRVYNRDTCVSCCGTCNVAKYRYTEDDFLSYCKRVADFQTSRGVADRVL